MQYTLGALVLLIGICLSHSTIHRDEDPSLESSIEPTEEPYAFAVSAVPSRLKSETRTQLKYRGYYGWAYVYPAPTLPSFTTHSIAYSGSSDPTEALANSHHMLPGFRGHKFIALGGPSYSGIWSKPALDMVLAAIDSDSLKGYDGICFDVVQGSRGLSNRFSYVFAAAKSKNLTVMVSFPHSQPLKIADGKSLVRSFIKDKNIDILSPQMYSIGLSSADTVFFSLVSSTGTPWTAFNASLASIAPSIFNSSYYDETAEFLGSKGIKTSGFFQMQQFFKTDASMNYCGKDEVDAYSCRRACPSGLDFDCGAGETCHTGVSCLATENLNNNFCGSTYMEAALCSSTCPTGFDWECGAGMKCFTGVECGAATDKSNYQNLYCGSDPTDSGKCNLKCSSGFDSECPTGQRCFENVSCGDSERALAMNPDMNFCGNATHTDCSIACPSGLTAECGGDLVCRTKQYCPGTLFIPANTTSLSHSETPAFNDSLVFSAQKPMEVSFKAQQSSPVQKHNLRRHPSHMPQTASEDFSRSSTTYSTHTITVESVESSDDEYLYLPDTNIIGGDIAYIGGPNGDCEQQCESTNDCVAYVMFRESSEGCWLKSSEFSDVVDYEGLSTYFKGANPTDSELQIEDLSANQSPIEDSPDEDPEFCWMDTDLRLKSATPTCPPGKENADGYCTEPCKDGYAQPEFYPRDLCVIKKCPPGYFQTTPLFCHYDGATTINPICEDSEYPQYWGGFCYHRNVNVWLLNKVPTYAGCPKYYNPYPLTCTRCTGSWPWEWHCNTINRSPECGSGYYFHAGMCYARSIGTSCSDGFYKSTPSTCEKRVPSEYVDKAITALDLPKLSHTRSTGKPPSVCESNQELQLGICFDNCPNNGVGIGPVCWSKCAEGYIECGAGCAKDENICGRITADQVISTLSFAFSLYGAAAAGTAAKAAIKADKVDAAADSVTALSKLYDMIIKFASKIGSAISYGTKSVSAMGKVLKKIKNQSLILKPLVRAHQIYKVTKLYSRMNQLVEERDKGASLEQLVKTGASIVSVIVDPLGIIGVTLAFSYPKCGSKRIEKKTPKIYLDDEFYRTGDLNAMFERLVEG